MTNDHHHDADGSASKMKKRAVVGIEKFAHQKGVVKALHDFRERKEKKRLETAKSLRHYKKAMKKEGFEPGTGASRKRKQQEQRQEQSEEDGKDSSDAIASQHPAASTGIEKRADDGKKSPHKKQKWNNNKQREITSVPTAPLSSKDRQRKADAAAAEREVQVQQRRQQEEKERKQALRRRRQRHERLSARTSKGQPVMKNIVHDILAKLQKEKKQESSK
jgi:rRNA processing